MLKIIAKNVELRLKAKVRGTITCHIIAGNTLVCDIIHKDNVFRYTEKFTQQEILWGLSSQSIAEQIICAYINSIKQKFFKF